jgi:hypothetical protein
VILPEPEKWQREALMEAPMVERLTGRCASGPFTTLSVPGEVK